VKISFEKQQAIGVRIGTVEKKHLAHILRILGRVAVDETRIYRVNAATDGWVQQTFPNSTGALVKKDEVLAIIYAPEFQAAEQNYIYTLNALDRLQATRAESAAQISQTKISIQQAADSLRNLGMGETQIKEVARTKEVTKNIELRSPAAGFVLLRNVSPGQRFERGTEFYRIADLSHVWVLADVFEYEAEYLKPGLRVKFTLPRQKKTFEAKVSDVLPQFDQATRTLKLRLETNNLGFALKPDMFVDVELPIQMPPAIAVPMDAILDSGITKIVFVDQGNGFFAPREVETGWRIGNRVEIVRGLEVGEKIVTSGTFLIDSESKLEMAAQGMYATLGKDPVCGLEVSPKKAEKEGRRISFQGKTYYFDSEECKQKFEKAPKRYLKE
jgi:RND family efflux transporter MFP subunit